MTDDERYTVPVWIRAMAAPPASAQQNALVVRVRDESVEHEFVIDPEDLILASDLEVMLNESPSYRKAKELLAAGLKRRRYERN